MQGFKINIKPVQKEHMSKVIDMLQSISLYKPNESELDQIWNNFINQNNVHSFVALLESRIVGYGSIVIEKKIRGGVMGHIEDIVTDDNFRFIGVGKAIVNYLVEVAKREKCYKINLNCSKENITFYEKCGFKLNCSSMTIFSNER